MELIEGAVSEHERREQRRGEERRDGRGEHDAAQHEAQDRETTELATVPERPDDCGDAEHEEGEPASEGGRAPESSLDGRAGSGPLEAPSEPEGGERPERRETSREQRRREPGHDLEREAFVLVQAPVESRHDEDQRDGSHRLGDESREERATAEREGDGDEGRLRAAERFLLLGGERLQSYLPAGFGAGFLSAPAGLSDFLVLWTWWRMISVMCR